MRQGRPRRSEECPDSPFGKALKELLRQEAGFTQARLAEESMVSAETLSRMMKGKRLNGTATRFHLRNIVRALHRFGLLDTVEAANRLLTRIPAVKELDERDEDDLKLIQELEESEVRWHLDGIERHTLALDISLNHMRVGKETLHVRRSMAWSLYVELTTRIALQPVEPGHELLRETLHSLSTLFQETCKTLRESGDLMVREGEETVGSLALHFLHHDIRPFLARWRPLLLAHEKTRPAEISEYDHQQRWERVEEMRKELTALQKKVEGYARQLAKIAGIRPTDVFFIHS
jgi:transcriptional regulator with XRE-family HTH domain